MAALISQRPGAPLQLELPYQNLASQGVPIRCGFGMEAGAVDFTSIESKLALTWKSSLKMLCKRFIYSVAEIIWMCVYRIYWRASR